ncbi:oxygenase MpaB family protein [Chryseobacterium indoltheticum]|uniref:oxygenase MpaB family protein n=1 Tax=Chryseobacterium indoltheticum TaxID=254 RepID=UPI003F496484
MMATYIGFSLVFMHSLHKFGNIFSEEEERGLFHLWKYVGYLLGIPENLLPDNKKQATEYFYLWTSVQPSSDKDSVFISTFFVERIFRKSYFKNIVFKEKIYAIYTFAVLGFCWMMKFAKDFKSLMFLSKKVSLLQRRSSIKYTILR